LFALLATLDVSYYLQKTENVYHVISCLPTVFERAFEKFIKRNGVMVHYHKGYVVKKWSVAHCHKDCVQC